ncbi:MAG: ribbon-helix-helix protein, CopG family [Chloroflexi bacterium]|nr:ribbon-helix-helix protein, CopG family [Chloroflexota bacterium]MCC6895934.1 ribbon-helix-helix protein, CopG family [Anaerolineae bacterium]
MATHTTIELEQILPPEVYERLQAEATRLQASLSDVVREAIEEYLDIPDDEDYEDTPDEQIIADIRQGLHEALTGQTIPADEAMALIRKQIADEQD